MTPACALTCATGGAVTAAAQTMKLKAWLTSQGVALPRRPKALKGGLKYEDCLEAEDIQKLLAGSLPSAEARAALELRLQAAQSAASKVDRMLLTRCADDRVRGLFRFYGATTGRWSRALFQSQNLKKPELLKSDEAIEEAIALVLTGDYRAVKARYQDVLGLVGDLCRSMLVPAPGHRFIIGDFKAIEARVLAHLAGAAGKLESFRHYDLGLGPDLYIVTAGQVLGAEISGEHVRPLGKVFELGLGFQLGADRLFGLIRDARISGTENATPDDAAR
jgi:DNA polymerase